MAGPASTWPAAVSERSAALVRGPLVRATVLAAFPSALYLQVGGHTDVLPVVARQGLRLPTALALATPLPTVGWGAQPGDEVVVGAGEVRLPGVVIRAVRTWRPQCVGRATGSPGYAPLATLPLAWRRPGRALVEQLVSDPAEPDRLARRVASLVGAGPGLTPSGDDVLCGVLLGLRLHPRGSARHLTDLWQAVRPRLTATTSLSAALLREAADGYAAEPVTRLLHLLAAPGRASSLEVAAAEAVRAVLAIGHTSGADLLGGLSGCLDALDATGGPGGVESPGASLRLTPSPTHAARSLP